METFIAPLQETTTPRRYM